MPVDKVGHWQLYTRVHRRIHKPSVNAVTVFVRVSNADDLFKFKFWGKMKGSRDSRMCILVHDALSKLVSMRAAVRPSQLPSQLKPITAAQLDN